MTDFIHEHPKNEPAPSPAPPREETPMDEETGQKRVYGYIFILFVVAFGLLVWSFFMNQRSTDEVLSELRGNADALQTAITRNVELERKIDAAEDELDAANEEIARLKQSASQQELSLREEQERSAARELLWLLEYRWANGEYDACRALTEQMKPYVHALNTADDGNAPSELARYQELAAALNEIDATEGETELVP